MRLFCVGFPKERRDNFFSKNFLRLFFRISSPFLIFPHFFSIFIYLSTIFLMIFLKNERGYLQGDVKNGRLALVYQDTLMLVPYSKEQLALVYPMLGSFFCHIISLQISVFLDFCLFRFLFQSSYGCFGGLSKLHFIQILYVQKALDVQFPTVLALLYLELQSSRYRAQNEGDATLKNFGRLFLKNSYLSIRSRYCLVLLVKIR